MLESYTCVRDFDLLVNFDRLLCSQYSLSANKLYHGIGDAGMVGHGELWPKKDANLAQIGIISMKSIYLNLYNKVSLLFQDTQFVYRILCIAESAPSESPLDPSPVLQMNSHP